MAACNIDLSESRGKAVTLVGTRQAAMDFPTLTEQELSTLLKLMREQRPELDPGEANTVRRLAALTDDELAALLKLAAQPEST